MKKTLALLSLACVLLMPPGSRAATPASGTLAVGKTVSWSGGPLNGAAILDVAGGVFGRGNEVCRNGVNCDDFSLAIRIPAGAFKAPAKPVVHISLTVGTPNDMQILLFEPGHTGAPGSSVNIDYTSYGTDARVLGPKNGTWLVRVACAACVNASYSAVARVEKYVSPALPALGSYGWSSGILPGAGQGEPGINIDKHSRIFINAPAADTSVWTSLNKGRTWTLNDAVEQVQGVGFGSGDSDLAVAPDDETVYVANLNPETFTNDVMVSTDHGATYTGPSFAGAGSDRPWIAAGPNGVLYLGYHDLASSNQVWVWRSSDHGKTFTQVGDVALGTDLAAEKQVIACGTGIGHPMVDPNDANTVYFLFTTGSDQAKCEETLPNANDFPINQVWIARSTDGGKNWSQTLVYLSSSTVGHFWPADGIDRAGNVYVVTSETGPKAPGEVTLSTHVLLFGSKDHGVTWTKPIRVDRTPSQQSNVFPAVAGGDAGRVSVAWYQSSAKDWFDTKGSWTVGFAQSLDVFSAAPHFKQSRATGVIHIGDVCQSGLFCLTTGSDRDLLDFLGIAVAPDGASYIAWASDLTGDVKVGYSRQAAGPNLNAPKRRH